MLHAHTRESEPPQSSLYGITLIPDEEIRSTLGMDEADSSEDKDILLLTDKRIIQVSGSDAKRRASFAAIDDILAVELTRQTEGYGAFVWAALAFFVSVMLLRVIESQTISLVAAVLVALMGVYLIIDRLTSRGARVVVFKTGASEIRGTIKNDAEQSEAEALIADLFALKDERATPRRARAFAPR